ncbi:hypothetical protein Taro_035602, partial [Colocasia esculenta]|nr:hypothetical protein [Colocasia esculenta]
LGEFPTKPVTSEAHPYSPQARARRRFRYRLPVQGRAAAVLGQRLQQCSFRSSVVSFLSCSEGCLEDRGICGGDESREETPWRGAIPVGARGGFDVNQKIAGVGYPRFFVSQARVFVVLGVLSRYLCCTVEVCVVFLDTLTPEFELYVRLRERRQWDNDFPEFVLVSLPETLEVPGMGLQLCVCRCGVGWSPQLFDFFLVERQLDLSSVTARLRVEV